MNILIVSNSKLPVFYYGGTERIIWCLGRTLTKLGNKVTFLAKQGSKCDFAKIIERNTDIDLVDQIPDDVDIVHFHFTPKGIEKLQVPYLVTIHGNPKPSDSIDKNTVFVSKNHAERHNADAFVYNGLDWDDYGTVDLLSKREYFHFLGKAAWRVKNVKGAIKTTLKIKAERLHILGGSRLNIKMGFRFTWQRRARFYGMIDGDEKIYQLKHSKGLVFPVRWHEPFGIAIIESMYFGAPVFGTPYGSLPEIVNNEVGLLSNSSNTLSEAMSHYQDFNRNTCHDYAATYFNSKVMSKSYLKLYEKVMNNEPINQSMPITISKDNPKFLDWKK